MGVVLLFGLGLTGVFLVVAFVLTVIKEFWWIILPIVLAIISGVIVYFVKKENKAKSEKRAKELNKRKEIIQHGEKLISSGVFQHNLKEAVVWYRIFENIASGQYGDSVLLWHVSPFVDDKYKSLVNESEKPTQADERNEYKDEYVYLEMVFSNAVILAVKETYFTLKKMGDYDSAEKTVYNSCFKGLFGTMEEARKAVGGFDWFLEHLSESPGLDAVLIKGFRTGGKGHEDSLVFIEELKNKCQGIKSSARWYDYGPSRYRLMLKKQNEED